MKGGLKSLISGVQDLQKEWPGLDVPDGRIHDLVGFLFAALPLAEKELDDGETSLLLRHTSPENSLTHFQCLSTRCWISWWQTKADCKHHRARCPRCGQVGFRQYHFAKEAIDGA